MSEKKIGRPPFLYTDELGNEICNAIASNSVGITKLCNQNSHWPSRETMYQWLANNTSFADKYARAKQQQIELLVDEIIEISDDTSQDTIINENGTRTCNSEFIARSKLRIDSRKWLASKLVPKVYGVHKQDESAPGKTLVEMLMELKHSTDACNDVVESMITCPDFMR